MVTSQDFAFMERALAWRALKSLPLCFQYGARLICGWPSEATPTITKTQPEAHVCQTTVCGVLADGLEIRMECVEYTDFPVVEYTVLLTNRGATDSQLVDSLCLKGEIAEKSAELIHGNGDTVRPDGYRWQRDALPLAIGPVDGTSCNGAFPYMRLATPGGLINLAVGWPTQWEARFALGEQGVQISVGQKRCHTVLRPGETLRTPRLTLQFCAGEENRATNLWRRWYFAHVLPRPAGQPLRPLLCLHHLGCDGKPEATAASEENQLHALREYLRNGLQPDVWWLDAGWYPCDFVWTYTGTWIPDTARFPRGLLPLAEACQECGAKFLLWFEPERAQAGSWLAENHPEWMLTRHLPDGALDFDRLVNLGDPACCDALIKHVDALIKQYHIGIYRQDFNFNPAPFWQENEAPNRIGMLENLHGQGYLRYWDALLARNPGLLIDSCASGGRRNDMETMRRAVPLHYTDMGYGNHPLKQLQHRQMFAWLPYFRAHNMNWLNPDHTYGTEKYAPDEFSYYAALAPCLTDVTPYFAPPEAFALARRMQPIWRRAAEYMLSGDYYPLTDCRADSSDFYAMQFHCAKSNEGFANIVSNVCNEENAFLLRLQALESQALYRLADAGGTQTMEYTGAQLADGISVSMAAHSAIVYFYQKIG